MFKFKNKNTKFRLSDYIGHFLALLMAFLFILVYSQAIYSVLFWKDHFFSNTQKLKLNCDYFINLENKESFSKVPDGHVELPNNSPLVFEFNSNGKAVIKHECTSPVMVADNIKGMPMIHLGWIYGGLGTDIYLNGTKRAFVTGKDKVSLGLTADDIAKSSFQLKLITRLENTKNAGLYGYAPIVIGFQDKQNQKILGLSFALDTFYSFVNISPVLVISIFLTLSWFTGIRSRLTVVTFYYFLLIALHNITQIFPDYMPWDDVNTGRKVWGAFMPSVAVAFILFSMELLGIYQKKINRFMVLNLLLLIGLLLYVLFFEVEMKEYLYIYNLQLAIKTTGSIFLIGMYLYKVKKNSGEVYLNRVRLFFLTIIGLYGSLAAYELVMGIFFNSYIGFSSRVVFIVCIVVGLVVFYAISLIEKNYQVAKSEKERIQSRLELGQAVQELLLPESKEGVYSDWGYQFFYKPAEFMAGDWLAFWKVGNGELRLIIGDVTGKGPQAALAVSAIASVVEECKIHDYSMEESIRSINTRLVRLFKGKVGTTLLAVNLQTDGKADLYNCGSVGWLEVEKDGGLMIHPLRSTGLGVSKTIDIGHKVIELNSTKTLVAFTDGILEGSRGLKKLKTNLKNHPDKILREDILRIVLDSGKDFVLEDDKTMLMVWQDSTAS